MFLLINHSSLGNGVGDACQGDFDDDDIPDFLDNCPNNSKIYATDFRFVIKGETRFTYFFRVSNFIRIAWSSIFFAPVKPGNGKIQAIWFIWN